MDRVGHKVACTTREDVKGLRHEDLRHCGSVNGKEDKSYNSTF